MFARKTLQRAAVLTLLPLTGVAVAAGTASAWEGTRTVSNSSSCVAKEIVQLVGHDEMAVDPIANSADCWFGIWNWNSSTWTYQPTTSGAESPYEPDGIGMSLSACVWVSTNPTWICGPSN